MKKTQSGILMIISAAIGFGTIGVFGELTTTSQINIPTLLSLRFTLAMVAVLMIASYWNWPLPRSRREWMRTLFLGIIYTLMTLFYFASLRHLTAGVAVVTLYLYPAIVFFYAIVFLDEVVTGRKIAALCLAFSGVVLVVSTNTTSVDPIGIALAATAAICYAIYTVGSRSFVSALPPKALLIGVLAGTMTSIDLFGFMSGEFAVPGKGYEWLIVLGITLVGTVVPLVLFYEGVARVEASRVSIVSTTEPVVTVILGVVLLNEPITATMVIGGMFVVVSVLLAQRSRGAV